MMQQKGIIPGIRVNDELANDIMIDREQLCDTAKGKKGINALAEVSDDV